MSASQPGWCRRRRAATEESDSTQLKGYTSRAERAAGFTKTRLCKFFVEGKCTRGKKCTFAHGEEDKDSQPQPVYMKLCKTLIATGRCKNPNCRYAHSKEDIVVAKQLTAGLVDSSNPDGSAIAMPSESGCDQPVGQLTQLPASNLNTHSNVRWFGFLCNIRWVCPQRAPQRVMGAPPGVLEPPIASPAAVSYPAMQMTPSELPAARQVEENSVSSEPAFHVVVKNTFIDIVETSPRSIHRSRSEPPRFMSKDLETRPRCQTAVEDLAVVLSAEQQEFSCPPEATLAPASQTDVEVPPPPRVIQENSLEDCSNPATVVKTSRGHEITAFSSMTFPTFEVRNTFIEVCQGLPKAEALRPVRSAEDLLALEREAAHQAQN